jgi:hypothetical protein
MDYEKPGIVTTFIANDLYASASGFQSVGDDSPGHCGNDTTGPGFDASC